MAGEIQLNSTTMATESSGTITLSNVDSATNRTNLGLGSIATQAADSVSISGGNITGGNITGGTIGSGVVFPTGHLIQVSSNNFNTQASRTSTSFGAFSSGITATINNCSTGNDILILLSVTFGVSALEYGEFRLVDTTNSNAIIGTEGTDGLIGRLQVSNTYTAYSHSISVLYTPPAFSSGSLTVELYGRSTTGTLYLNRSGQGTSEYASSLTLIEVQG